MRFSIVKTVFILSTFTLALWSCGTAVDRPISIKLETTAEGPFFAGPNSLIGDYAVDLDVLFPGQNVTAEQISSVSPTGVTIRLRGDSINFSAFNSATIQFVSETESMVTVANINPLNSSDMIVSLQTATDASLETFFKQKAFTCVVDLDFKEDDYRDNLTTEISIDFTATIKQ